MIILVVSVERYQLHRRLSSRYIGRRRRRFHPQTPSFSREKRSSDWQLFIRGVCVTQPSFIVVFRSLARQLFFSIDTCAHVEIRLTIEAKRVVINHTFRPYYVPTLRRDVKSKVIYELISALARAYVNEACQRLSIAA